MSDFTKVYRAAWRKYMPHRQDVKFVGCSWHFDRNTVLNIKNTEILAAVRALRLCPDEEDFWALLEEFEDKYGDEEGGSYFIHNYGRHGAVAKPQVWARCFNRKFCPHNLFAERYILLECILSCLSVMACIFIFKTSCILNPTI